jgi:hypothetical protein
MTSPPRFCIDCNQPTVTAQRCRKCRVLDYIRRPKVKARRREYGKKYRQRADVKVRRREYRQQPGVKAKEREYERRPHVKLRKHLRDAVHRSTDQYRAKQRKRNQIKHNREISAKAAYAQKVLQAVINGDPIPDPELTSRQRYRLRPDIMRKYAEYSRRDDIRARENARERMRYATDPQYREKRNATRNARRREKYATDAKYREKIKARVKKYRKKEKL